jgi:hypothetical protein
MPAVYRAVFFDNKFTDFWETPFLHIQGGAITKQDSTSS